MKSCTFFGTRYVYDNIEPVLTKLLIKLIENGVGIFYVGAQGAFDRITVHVLKNLKRQYEHISFNIVLAYIPTAKNNCQSIDFDNTIFPDGLESVPKRYAVVKRNRWMIEKSDYVVVYVKNSFGNAAKLKEYSKKELK